MNVILEKWTHEFTPELIKICNEVDRSYLSNRLPYPYTEESADWWLSKDLSLSVIAQGFWRLTGWEFTTQELASFMNGCIDRGVTTFDTAEVYGGTHCERLMGEAASLKDSISPSGLWM